VYVGVRIDKWSEARELCDMTRGCVFRGQADASWTLSTQLERAACAANCPPEHIANREAQILREFRRSAHHYDCAVPDTEDVIEWLALIQHHGGPTRLLDFTYSFYVAAFFAMESAVGDAAVWVFNRTGRIGRGLDGAKGLEGFAPKVNAELGRLAGQYFNGDIGGVGVIATEPERLSPRLVAQQGTFVIPMDVAKPFEENLAEALGLSGTTLGDPEMVSADESVTRRLTHETADLIKILLPRDIHPDALEDLWQMNISAATLFPGLDGFARSLGFHMRVAEKFAKLLDTLK